MTALEMKLNKQLNRNRAAHRERATRAAEMLPEMLKGIGRVERGSLEEIMWTELGILPPS